MWACFFLETSVVCRASYIYILPTLLFSSYLESINLKRKNRRKEIIANKINNLQIPLFRLKTRKKALAFAPSKIYDYHPVPHLENIMKLTFLKAPVSLTKSFTKQADGSIKKSSYPNVYEVTTINEPCADLRNMEKLLKGHAALGHCLLKGNPMRDLVCESRAGTTDSGAVTDWIVLDLDGVPNCSSVEDFLRALNLSDISYLIQWSASHGISSNDLRAHVYMQLATPLAAPLVKQWLIGMNHSITLLKNAMTLTKTGNSISWPLDISACQNDKLLYIAPPILKGIKDPMAKKQRIEYVPKKSHHLNIITINSTAQNRELTNKRINEIREAQGYPSRKTTYKMHGNIEVMNKPDACVVTDMRAERGFVYFNLNGGDSWGYYHPEDNPDYIHNFKGEPSYVTKELLPEYWQSLTSQPIRTSSQGVTYLAFCDRKSGAYWRGTHDAQTDTLDIHMAKTKEMMKDFAKLNGLTLGGTIPEWDMAFDPQDNVRVDIGNKTINTFQPTVYMLAPIRKVSTCPKTILKVIHHALGSDQAATDHFLNWIAFILQFRDRTKTAWVLHGTQGTGKGILMNNILRPIFGFAQTSATRAETLSDRYNGSTEKCFLVFADEVDSDGMKDGKGMMAKLKNFITEEFIEIRHMHMAPYEVKNHTNWIFASNKPEPVKIDREDRRFNVGKYQPTKIIISQKEIDELIPKELQGFHDYLMSSTVNKMIRLSEISADRLSSALAEGDFEFLVSQLPTGTTPQTDFKESNKLQAYIDVLKILITRSDDKGKCNVSRDELRPVFEYVIGDVPTTPYKFTTYLGHRRIETTKVWIDGKSVPGIRVDWTNIDEFLDHDALTQQKPPQPKLKVVKV